MAENHPRDCGPCTICCRFFAVPETGKPTNQWCEHCTDQGCAVHATRPQSCRNFQCFWLLEPQMPEELRPDLCGVVVSFNEEHTSVVIHVDPDRPDALAEEPGSWWMEPLLNAYDPVCLVCGDDKMVVRRETQA